MIFEEIIGLQILSTDTVKKSDAQKELLSRLVSTS